MPRFTGVLLSLLLFLLVYPISVELQFGEKFLTGILTLLLLSVLTNLAKTRRDLWIAVGLLLAEQLSTWWAVLTQSLVAIVAAQVFVVLLFSYIALVIIQAVLNEKDIRIDTVFGALCVYLIMGFAWAGSYGLIETLKPGSFSLVADLAPTEYFLNFVYFSLVTLTTLGYGDLVPLSPTAKSFAIVEALVGQIFLAVLVARLIASSLQKSRAHAEA